MLQTAAEIRECAYKLMASLRDLPDATSDEWTQEVFGRLDKFARSENSALKTYYRDHSEKAEFLWDFLAVAPETGIFLVAESEQAIGNERQITALKHDFEKLLYVYSPLRILVTKARNRDHAGELVQTLESYAHGCCLAFNPGAVFILHFGLWNDSGNVSYLWQSKGEPSELGPEPIHFVPRA